MQQLRHKFIYEDILGKIKKHIYEEGDLLPGEIKLCEMYQASRTPVRQALRRLYEEGFIVRRAGKGTFVAGRKYWPNIEMGGFSEELLSKGPYLNCHTLKVEDVVLDDAEAADMQVPFHTKAVQVERIRYYNDEPIHFLQHYVIGLDSAAIAVYGNFSSMLAIYNEKNIPVAATLDRIEAVAASAKIAKLLDIPLAYPLLLVNRYTYTDENKLLEFVRFYVKTKQWQYRARYRNHIES